MAAVEQASRSNDLHPPSSTDLSRDWQLRSRRVDAADKVTGAALYPADLRRQDFLHARVVFTNQPHARLLRMNVGPALAVPGVIEIVTAADVPVNEYGLVFGTNRS